MSASIFWWCALVLLPPLFLIIGPVQFILGIIAQVAAVIILLTDSVIPNQYIWGALIIFIIQCLPPIRALGGMATELICKPIPGGRTVNVGDAIVGSIAGLIYNLDWLDFANNNPGSWLIYLNYILSSIGIWLFISVAITNRLVHKND